MDKQVISAALVELLLRETINHHVNWEEIDTYRYEARVPNHTFTIFDRTRKDSSCGLIISNEKGEGSLLNPLGDEDRRSLHLLYLTVKSQCKAETTSSDQDKFAEFCDGLIAAKRPPFPDRNALYARMKYTDDTAYLLLELRERMEERIEKLTLLSPENKITLRNDLMNIANNKLTHFFKTTWL
jgi:hypothetical protein